MTPAEKVLAEALRESGWAPNERLEPHFGPLMDRMAVTALAASPDLNAALTLGLRIMDENDPLLLSAVLLYMGKVWKSGRNAQPIADGLRAALLRATDK